MRKILIVLLFFIVQQIFSADLQKTIYTDYQKGNLSYHQYLVYRGYTIFAPEKLRDLYPSLKYENALKSGTGIILELKENWNTLSNDEKEFFSQFIYARPSLNYSYISSNGNFKVHYNTTNINSVPSTDINLNGIPDYVESVALALDKARSYYVDTLGYSPPYLDNGEDGPEFDVYLKNLGNVYGQTFLPPNVYMEIENDFSEAIFYTKGVNGALVTAVHELHHAVQFSYIIRSQDFFFYEVTSTFMEDVVFDEINDYYQYLPSFFRSIQTPFTMRDGYHEYGLGIYGHYLSKRYGKTIMREIWDNFKNNIPILDALDYTLKNHGSNFNDALNEFYMWNYFTGTRADSINYYDESANYPEITNINEILVTNDTTISVSNNYLTPSYVLYDGLIPTTYELTAKTTDNNYINLWDNKLLLTKTSEEGTLLSFSNTDSITENVSFVNNSETNTEALIILTSIARISNSIPGSGGNYNINLGIKVKPINEIKKNALREIYPNPFILNEHSSVKIAFTLEKSSDIKIIIFSLSGKIVKKIERQDVSEGIHQYDYSWDGMNDDNVPVPSGIYLCQLNVGKFSEMKKIAIIRK